MPKQLVRLAALFFLIASVLFIPCAGQGGPSPALKSGTADPAQEAAIIEESSTSARFENDGTNQQTVRQRVKILNEAGLKQYGIITFNFIAGQEFNIDTVEVHKKDGTTVKAGPGNVQEVTPEISRVAPIYSDLHQKQVTVPGLAVGDEILFQYSAKQTALVPNQFWFQYSFSRDAIVLSESVEVNVPQQRKLHIHYQPEYEPVTKNSGDRTVYTWHSSNEKLDDAEKRIRARRRQLLTGTAPPPSLELSTFESWEQVGSWYYLLQRERATPTPAIRAKALELTKGIDSPEAKTRALYQFVSSNFRYIGLDFGIGRYQPHAADQVLSNGYGDCKDKHTLLAALLEAAGLTAYPVLISAHREFDPGVPSPAQFDHLITAIPSGTGMIFLDTTAEVAPYGMLLSPLRHKKALVISGPASAKFVETPTDPPFPVQEVFEFNGRVDDSGAMEADVSVFVHGDLEVLLKSAFRQAPPSKHKEIVQLMARGMGFGGEVSAVNVTGLQDTENGLRISYHYHRADYFDLGAQPPKNSLPLGFLLPLSWDEKDDSLRLYTSPGEVTHRCKVELPQGFTAQPPLPIKLDREYLRYASTYSAQKNVLIGEKKLTVLVPELDQSRRQDFEAFRRAVQTDESQEVVLRLPPDFVAKAKPASPGDVEELMRRAEIEARESDFADAYADFRKVADLDPKRKGVWTQIGLTEGHLQRFEEAAKDYLKALEIDPFDAQAHAELGGIYIVLRRNDAAVDELRKAVEIDPLLHRGHYLLGWYYAQGKKDYAAAVPELEKALATKTESSNDEWQIREFLADGYFKTQQREKGLESLKSLVEHSPNPTAWNNAAYMLAENGWELDVARQYADSALKGIYEHLNQVQADAIRRDDLVHVAQLAMTWDTMGWIRFKSGDAVTAEKYVLAAWILGQSSTVGEHLGEIYEKLGRRPDAIRYYAMSARMRLPFPNMPASAPDPARERLIKLVGRQQAETAIQQHFNDSSQSRTVHLGRIAPAKSKGEFYFVFAPGPKLVSVQLVNGDETLTAGLRKQADRIAATVVFPEGAPEKLVRQGLVACSSYSNSCDLVFYTSDIPAATLIGRPR